MRKLVVFLLVVALFSLAAAPAIGGMMKPPGLHKAPAMYRADPHGSCLYCHEPAMLDAHEFCARCHPDQDMAPCTGAECHGLPPG